MRRLLALLVLGVLPLGTSGGRLPAQPPQSDRPVIQVGADKFYSLTEGAEVMKADRPTAGSVRVTTSPAISNGFGVLEGLKEDPRQGECKNVSPMHWESWPASAHWVAKSQVHSGDLSVINGQIVDIVRQRRLVGICPGAVVRFLAAKGVLMVTYREVVRPVISGKGSVIGLEFSGYESVVRVSTQEARILPDTRFKGSIRALAIEPGTGNLLVARESASSHSVGGWLRAISGHPRQVSTYELQILDSQGRQRSVMPLCIGEPGATIEVWF